MADVYSKKQDLPVYAEPNPSASVVTKLKFAEKASVISDQNRWLNIKTSSGKTGWVYSGNVGDRRPPEENKADLLAPSSGVDTAAAGRGLSEAAQQYAQSRGYGDATSDLTWLDKENASISSSEIKAYMKEHKLGEFAS